MENKIQKSELIFLFILVLFSFFYRMIFLYTPFNRDEGTFAYIADRMTKGELPYRDTLDNSQPFIYFIYKTAFDFFGKSDEAVRTFTNFYVLLTFLVFYSFIRMSLNKWPALLSLFLFILHLNNHNLHGLNSNKEVFLILPLFLAFIFLLNYDNQYFHLSMFLSGFFLGIVVFINLISFFVLFVPILYIIKYVKKNKMKYIVWFISGFVFLISLIFLWAVKNNILKEFIECNFLYNPVLFFSFDFKNVFFILAKDGFLFIKTNLILFLGFLYGFYKIFKNKKNNISFISFLTVFFFYFSIFLFSNGYPHYYLVLIPSLSILSTILIYDFYCFLLKKSGNKNILLVIILIVIISYSSYFLIVNNFFNFVKNANRTTNIFYEAKTISEIINIDKNSADCVFVFTNEPQIYFYTHTKSPFKFIHNYPGLFSDYKNTFLNTDFLVLEKNNSLNNFLKSDFKKIIEFKNLILYKKRGDKNEKNK